MTKPLQDSQLTRQEREWRRRRGEILETATRLFMELGYNGTTMQMIADEAEFSVGYIYKHFPGKQELLAEIIESQLQIFAEIRSNVRTRLDDRPLTALREELRQVMLQLGRQAHLVSLILGRGSTDGERIRRRLKAYRQQDAALLEQAMNLGELRRTDPRLLAATLDGVIWGLIGLMSETGRMDQVNLIPQVVEDLVLGPLTGGQDGNERKDETP